MAENRTGNLTKKMIKHEYPPIRNLTNARSTKKTNTHLGTINAQIVK